MTDFFKKHTLIASTLLLTLTGFATRVLGFFYRIFLSRTIGAEGLGIFNMVHPVYGICFALCAGSIQTAISRFVAANVQKGKQIFRTGLIISLTLVLGLAALIIHFSAAIHGRIRTLLRSPRLYQRLLLWHKKDQDSRRIPDRGADYPNGGSIPYR